jgi:hypothetical protein
MNNAKIKRKLARTIHKLSGKIDDSMKTYVPPGHYYSPIISIDDVRNRKEEIWKEPSPELEGIDLNENEQLELLEKLKTHYASIPFKDKPSENLRYYFENSMYSYSDGVFLFCMMMHFKPKRIIEVGSGFSSALMLDVNGMFFNNKINCTFIEPYPDRLNLLLKQDESITLHQTMVQNIDLSMFEELNENDFLFIDSSHISKTGSGVNFVLFDVLPRLKKGVKIHFHDIFSSFEYPVEWVIDERRNWNEAYILRAFLSYNAHFKIIMFNHHLMQFHKEWFAGNMPLCIRNGGGSIWIEKQ